MSVFRERQEPQTEAPAPEPKEVPSHDDTNAIKATDPITPEEKKLEIWEGLNHNHKYALEYFDIHELADDFKTKMDISKIDKYVKAELDRLNYEKTVENYAQIIKEIEQEIGSSRLELFSRIKKIIGYAQVMDRIRTLNEKKKLYTQ